MKIISNFHDYYDSVMSYGHDPSYIYKRYTTEDYFSYPEINHVNMAYSTSNWRWKPRSKNYIVYEIMCLLFCGKNYYFYEIQNVINFLHQPNIYCWSTDQIRNSLILEKEKKKFDQKSKYKNPYRYDEFIKSHTEKVFSTQLNYDFIMEMHRKYQSPCLLIKRESNIRHKYKIIANPNLKEIQFVKVIDPYTTYQEIDMFMSGIIGKPEMVHRPISDEIMRDKKGFDEMSFKTYSPGERKLRRKENKKRKRGIII